MIHDTHSLPQQQQPNPNVPELSSATHSEHLHLNNLAPTEDESKSILRPSVVLQDQNQTQAQLRQESEGSNRFSSQDTDREKKQEVILSGSDTPPEKEDKPLDSNLMLRLTRLPAGCENSFSLEENVGSPCARSTISAIG